MFRDSTFVVRELTPFERLILGLLCEGKSNISIAHESNHTEKVIENTISRSAKAFGIHSDGDTNIRVLLALAYRSYFGDLALEHLKLECVHLNTKHENLAICEDAHH